MQLTGQKAFIATALGFFLVGLLIGWLVIGWWLWPVQWYDADPMDLRESHRRDFVAMVADSYAITHDLNLARQRFQGWPDQELSKILSDLTTAYTKQGRGAEAQRLKDLANALGVKPAIASPAPTEAAAAKATPTPSVGGSSLLSTVISVCGVLVVLVLVIAGAALGWSYWRKQRGSEIGKPSALAEQPAEAGRPMAAGAAQLGTFVTTYNLGDNSYDDCFPIETGAGEFLGECGVGVSEVLGSGDPSLVTAFEVWLFDKSDIRTVTKVLMSEFALASDELRDKLSPKGELVLAEPGKMIVLETAALAVQAEIKEMAYGAGQGPQQSHFARLTMELTAKAKEPGAADNVV